jgi:tRNA pseudouridine38-40 synthase
MTLFDLETSPRATPDGSLVRVRLTVAYDGTDFHGFARNPGVRTVAGVLTECLERVLRHRVELGVAGRTDKGVHAQGQVVSFDAETAALDLDALQMAVNKLCGPAIAVRDGAVVDPSFDARHSAVARHYRYTVLNRPTPDPFRARTAWHVSDALDVAAMRLACDPLLGEQDFSSFCRRPRVSEGRAVPSLTRRVIDARWRALGDDLLRFDISASSFCHQMVRSVVGTMIDVGTHRLRAGELRGIIEARDRAAAGRIAPPHGLCLWAVDYEGLGVRSPP